MLVMLPQDGEDETFSCVQLLTHAEVQQKTDLEGFKDGFASVATRVKWTCTVYIHINLCRNSPLFVLLGSLLTANVMTAALPGVRTRKHQPTKQNKLYCR